MENIESQTTKLRAESLENVEIKNHELTGNISVSKDKVLVISLPYSEGFQAYVDSQKTDLKQANTMYMALELTRGIMRSVLHTILHI